MNDEKILCRTPTPGKQPVNITRWKYEAVRHAILAAVPEQEPGILFKELSSLARILREGFVLRIDLAKQIGRSPAGA